MSIINAFDESKPIITPDKVYQRIEKLTDICIVTFSYHVIEKILSTYDYKEVAYSSTSNGHIPIYYLKELDVLVYLSPITSALSATILEEVAYITGVNNFIFFGSCGILDKCYRNKFIVPQKSYREEGFSYHYMKESDYIDMKNYNKIIEILRENNIDFVSGLNWTTDAIYKETINKCEKRRDEGCISVDMEASALQAISNYLNINLYIFFFAGDILKDDWDKGDLIGENQRIRQLNSFELALIIAKNIK